MKGTQDVHNLAQHGNDQQGSCSWQGHSRTLPFFCSITESNVSDHFLVSYCSDQLHIWHLLWSQAFLEPSNMILWNVIISCPLFMPLCPTYPGKIKKSRKPSNCNCCKIKLFHKNYIFIDCYMIGVRNQIFHQGVHFNIRMLSYQDRHQYHEYRTVFGSHFNTDRPSYIYDGNLYTWKDGLYMERGSRTPSGGHVFPANLGHVQLRAPGANSALDCYTVLAWWLQGCQWGMLTWFVIGRCHHLILLLACLTIDWDTYRSNAFSVSCNV